jgi:hypothetical protein
MSSIPTKQKPGGEVAKTKPGVTPRSARQHKPDRIGLSPTGGSDNRGKGQK